MNFQLVGLIKLPQLLIKFAQTLTYTVFTFNWRPMNKVGGNITVSFGLSNEAETAITFTIPFRTKRF